MKISVLATIIELCDMQEGRTKDGKNWQKRTVVIIPQNGEKKIAVDYHGEEKVKELGKYKVGDSAIFIFDVSSREYNARWYSQCDGWTIQPIGKTN